MGVYENIHQDTFLNVAKTAEFLKIHPESVRRLHRQGKLNGFKVGKALLFPKPYLIQFAKTYDPRPGNKRAS